MLYGHDDEEHPDRGDGLQARLADLSARQLLDSVRAGMLRASGA
jgi:hypothetical protein